jgi:hypothetical protein
LPGTHDQKRADECFGKRKRVRIRRHERMRQHAREPFDHAVCEYGEMRQTRNAVQADVDAEGEAKNSEGECAIHVVAAAEATRHDR